MISASEDMQVDEMLLRLSNREWFGVSAVMRILGLGYVAACDVLDELIGEGKIALIDADWKFAVVSQRAPISLPIIVKI